MLPQADTTPKRPKTGKRVDDCYAATLDDCDGPLTKEHFVSHEMLKQLGGETGKLNVTGIDPKKQGEIRKGIGTDKLVAPVLCERHNRALLPIDTAGNRFFEATAALGNVLVGEPAGTKRIIAVNGHDLERWCLKALCGFRARARKDVPELWHRILFGQNSILPPRGLYVYANVGDVNAGKEIGLEEILWTGDGAKDPIGIIVRMLNHELVFSMSTERPVTLPRHVDKWRVQRPEGFTLNAANGSSVLLYLSWQDNLKHHGITSDWAP